MGAGRTTSSSTYGIHSAAAGGDADRAHGPAVGKRTLVEGSYGAAAQVARAPLRAGGGSPEGLPRLELGGSLVQRRAAGADPGGGPASDAVIAASRGGGAPLPERVRTLFEERLAHDFSAVRVHTGSAAGAAARSIEARAYTIGNDIVFGDGQYQPDSPDGLHLLAHELVHVVQQGGGSKAAQRAGTEPGRAPAEARPPSDAGARLTRAAAQLAALHALVAPMAAGASDGEGVRHVAALAAGLEQLRAVIASGDGAAQARALEELARRLPPGMVDGVDGRGPVAPASAAPAAEHGPAAAATIAPAAAIAEQRAPGVAMAGLAISRVDDAAEQEAERVADAVMGGARVTVGAASGDVVYRGGEGGSGTGTGGGGEWSWVEIFTAAVIVIVTMMLAIWLAMRARAPRQAGRIATVSDAVAEVEQAREPKREAREPKRDAPPPKRDEPPEQIVDAPKQTATPPPPKRDDAPKQTATPPPPPKQTVEAPTQDTPTQDALKQDASAPTSTTKPESASAKKPAPKAKPIDRKPFQGDPLKVAGKLAGEDDKIFLELVTLMEPYSPERTGWAFTLCGRDLARTKELLAAAAPFPGEPVLQFLELEQGSALAVGFLKSIRIDLTDASLKEWQANFERWGKTTRAQLSKATSVVAEKVDADLIQRYGLDKAQWAAELDVDADVAAQWIALTDKKGGEPARRFVTAHMKSRRLTLFQFLEGVDDQVAVKRSASEWAREFEKVSRTELPRGADEGEHPRVAHGGGLVNNGTDCFLLAVCQLLSLPAYNAVPLLAPVRAIVTKVQLRQDVTGAEVQRLRTWLAQLGIVEEDRDLHEDAAELLNRLLAGANQVRLTEHHHIDQSTNGAEVDARLRPDPQQKLQYDGHGDLDVVTAGESMLQVPISNHDSLAAWLDGAHQDGEADRNNPNPARLSSYEWVSIGGQLRSVIQRTTRTSMHTLPGTLTIMLKRFGNDGRKLRKAFAMPQRFEVTEENPGGRQRKTYELQGVIYHRGNQGGGHYWAHRKDAARGWETANDSAVDAAHGALVPQEGDLEYDVNHGYIYTYTVTAGVPAVDWLDSAETPFDGGALPPEQVERRRGGRDGKQDGKPEDDQPKDGESGKKYGERNDVDHGQLWYGVDVLTNNRDHQQSKDSDTDPATGHLNEGPCAAVVTVLLDEMEKVGITGSCMVGVVLSLSGGWYATPSGRPSPRFGDAVRRTAEITGLPIEFVQRSNIAPVHSDNMRDKKARKYIDGTDISTFGPKAKSGQYQNYPQGGKDSEKEAALGAPGTCSLPKLVAHLIGLQDPPQHASEKWFSIDGKQVNVRVAEDDKQTTAHDHGDSVPSCRTCRPIVAEQMKGIDKAVASFLKEAKARTLAIAARRKAHAEALHRYTQIALAQLPAFSVDSSMVNEATGLDLERYAQMQEWYRSLVGILVGDRLEALVAANDERYAEADLDGELDLDLGPLVEARLQPPEDAAADDEAELDDDEEEQHGSKKQAKVNAKKQQKDAKRERKAQNRGKTKYRTGKSTPSAEVESAPPPPRREPTDADQIMVDILVELAGVSRLWAEMPKAAWSGVRRSTGFDFERNADKDLAVQLEVARIWDDLRAELGRLQSDNAESGEEED